MKRNFSKFGMVISVLIIIVGFLTLIGTFGDAHYSGSTTTYDSGFGVFGADYYTYSVNNSAEAASAARAAANNLKEISNLLCLSFGSFTICIGLISFCAFGIVLSDCSNSKKKRRKQVVAPVLKSRPIDIAPPSHANSDFSKEPLTQSDSFDENHTF